jgi:hypothetical protein
MIMSEQMVRMTVDIPQELKNKIKSEASLFGQKLRDYVVDALIKKLEIDEQKEDEYLIKEADKSKAEGSIGFEKSEKLLNEMLQCTEE